MSKPVINDGIKEREMTDAEYAEWQELLVEVQHRAKLEADRATAAKSARAKLSDLGLTAEEIAALVG